MSDVRRVLAAYLQQQADIDAPEFVMNRGFVRALRQAVAPAELSAPQPAPQPAAEAAPQRPRSSQPPSAPPPPPPRAAPRRRPLRDLHGPSPTAPAQPASTPAGSSKREQMKTLYYEVRECVECPLSRSRTKLVFGAGNVDSRLMVIGEAPGADEDRQGLPFVGRAGALLTDMLKAIGLDRENDTFITNVLKCRPPDNRTPESAERLHCLPILKRQIAIVRPASILLLGRTAAEALLERTEGIGVLRRQEHLFEGIPCFVTYHPAALLRNQSYKRPAWEDLKRLSAKLKETENGDATS